MRKTSKIISKELSGDITTGILALAGSAAEFERFKHECEQHKDVVACRRRTDALRDTSVLQEELTEKLQDIGE